MCFCILCGRWSNWKKFCSDNCREVYDAIRMDAYREAFRGLYDKAGK
jgi:predicted nucleic acid-binding Zn ribbon protein